MTTLRKLLRLSPAELSLVVQAALLLGAIGLGLRLLPFGRLRRLLDRLSRSGDGARPLGQLPAERVAWAIERVSRVVPGTRSCLAQALAAQVLLARRGQEACVRIGVARDTDGPLHAHAWVESEGRIVVGAAGRPGFSPLPRLEETGS